MEKMIDIEHLSFSYGDKVILRDVSFSVPKGGSICIVGMSGAGKSTLLKLICNLPDAKKQTPPDGKILIDGIDHKTFLKQYRGKIGYLFQSLSLMPNLTVEENIGFPSRLIDAQIENAEVSAIIEQIGLQGDIAKYPKELSGGMKTRVALASILLTKPEILLLDEPFSSLDIAWKYQLYKYYFKLKHEYSFTDIIVTHDIEEAIILSSQIYILNKTGTLSEPYNVDRSRFDISNERGFKDFLKMHNDTYLDIQEAILCDNFCK